MEVINVETEKEGLMTEASQFVLHTLFKSVGRCDQIERVCRRWYNASKGNKTWKYLFPECQTSTAEIKSDGDRCADVRRNILRALIYAQKKINISIKSKVPTQHLTLEEAYKELREIVHQKNISIQNCFIGGAHGWEVFGEGAVRENCPAILALPCRDSEEDAVSYAVRQNLPKAVRRHLKEVTPDQIENAVAYAVIANRPKLLQELLDAGVRDGSHRAVAFAVHQDSPELLQQLLDAGIRSDWDQPLLLAVNKNPTLVKQLLDTGYRGVSEATDCAINCKRLEALTYLVAVEKTWTITQHIKRLAKSVKRNSSPPASYSKILEILNAKAKLDLRDFPDIYL